MAQFEIGSTILWRSTASIILIEAGATLFFYPVSPSFLLALCLTRMAQTVAVFIVLYACGQGPAAVGLERDRLSNGIERGLLWSGGFGAAALIAMAGIYLSGGDPIALIRTPLPEGGSTRIMFFLVGGLVAPVAEEVFFRGIVYGFLRRWGILVAVGGTTLVFAALHMDRHGLPITQLVGGIVFCAAYERERRLMTPITIHALGNSAIFTLSLWASP